jgi:predicted phosphodiesterase
VERGILFFNPGSITIPRGRNPRTFGIIDIEEDGRVWSEIFNLDKCMVNTR